MVPGRPRRSRLFVLGSGFGAAVMMIVAALILLPIPAIWFIRWLPWPWIVRLGSLGNRFGPFLLAGSFVGFLAWDAERSALHNRYLGRVGRRGRCAVSIAGLFTLVMGIVVLGRP
jgi:hypothetical protein